MRDADEAETRPADKMLYVAGRTESFRCECGCNVFRQLVADESRYRCNGCGAVYVSEK